MTSQGKQQTSGIVAPHEHDVLSGRGNFVNYHAGNEHFRALVRKHKLEYVRCPKPQKGKFSRLIVEEIRNRNPPGRFLKQDGATKLWYDIGEKKALDKTRQALREGAPEIMKELTGDEDGSDGEGADTGLGGVHSDAFNMANAGAVGAGYDFGTSGMGTILPPPAESPVVNIRSHHHASPHTPPVSHVSGRVSHGMAAPGLMMPNPQLPSDVTGHMPQLSSQMHNPHDATLNSQTQQMNRQILRNNSGMGGDIIAGQGGGTSQDLHAYGGLDEMQALQNRLASIYPADQFEPRPIDPKLVPGKMSKPKNSSQEVPDKVVSGGQNSRRMPPPSLKRDDSLKISNIFNDGNPAGSSSKKKYDGNGSSAHLSTMSLSIGDMEEANLSSVFHDSLRVSSHTNQREKPKRKEEPATPTWGEADKAFDMSVATINDRFSENGNMSFATFGDGKMHESEGNMSFSQVFEDH